MSVATSTTAYKGEAISLSAAPTAATDITGWTLGAYVSRQVELRSSATPLLTLALGSGITVVSAAAGTYTVRLTSAQMTALGEGVFDIDIWRLDSGSETTLATVRLTILPAARG